MISEPFVVPRVIDGRRGRLMTLEDVGRDSVRSEIGDRLITVQTNYADGPHNVEERLNRCMTILILMLSIAEHADLESLDYAVKILYKKKTIICIDRDTHNGQLAREFNTRFPVFEKAIRL